MLRPLALLLPALLPSWRFFDVIAPSPRIEFRLLHDDQLIQDWQEFQPRPAHITLSTMFTRMLWNPAWNEQLFMVSCAERLLAHPTTHSEREIATRIQRHLDNAVTTTANRLQFRLLVIRRTNNQLQSQHAFTSALFELERAR